MKRVTVHRSNRAVLRQLAETVGWIEVGGKGAGWHGQIIPKGYKSQREMNEQGAGRTHWVGMPEWARGFGFNRDDAKRITLRAICGRPLGAQQYAFIRAMIREADDVLGTKNLGCPF